MKIVKSFVPGAYVISSEGVQYFPEVGMQIFSDDTIVGDIVTEDTDTVTDSDTDIAAIQQAILEGVDPTQITEATAAGAPASPEASNEGGNTFVALDRTKGEIDPEAGYETTTFTSLVEEPEDGLVYTIDIDDWTAPDPDSNIPGGLDETNIPTLEDNPSIPTPLDDVPPIEPNGSNPVDDEEPTPEPDEEDEQPVDPPIEEPDQEEEPPVIEPEDPSNPEEDEEDPLDDETNESENDPQSPEPNPETPPDETTEDVQGEEGTPNDENDGDEDQEPESNEPETEGEDPVSEDPEEEQPEDEDSGDPVDPEPDPETEGSGQNNGWGNGDQDAPGNSGDNNNAENSDADVPPGIEKKLNIGDVLDENNEIEEEIFPQDNASRGPQGNNGWGNGDDDAPGGSLGNTNAENNLDGILSPTEQYYE